MFEHIGLIAKRGNAQVKKCLEVVVNFLHSRHHYIVIDAPSARLLSKTDLNIAANTEALGNLCDL
jgi:hypothetical protein